MECPGRQNAAHLTIWNKVLLHYDTYAMRAYFSTVGQNCPTSIKHAVGVVLKLLETIKQQIFTLFLQSVYYFLSFRVAVSTNSGHDVSKRWRKQMLQTDEVLLLKNFVREDDLPRNILISFCVKFLI